VAEGQTQRLKAAQGRATRPTGADAAKQVTASPEATTRPLGRSSTTKGSNRRKAKPLREAPKKKATEK